METDEAPYYYVEVGGEAEGFINGTRVYCWADPDSRYRGNGHFWLSWLDRYIGAAHDHRVYQPLVLSYRCGAERYLQPAAKLYRELKKRKLLPRYVTFKEVAL